MAIILLVIVIAVLLVGLAYWFIQRQNRSKGLKDRFGAEYARTMDTAGTRGEGEKQLVEREKRVESFHLKDLDPREAQRFGDEWRNTQGRFVDNPGGAIHEADSLVQQVMSARGYPVTNFEQQAQDISVDHPEVLSNFRAAHAIAEGNAISPASTEALRQAMIHYRALFDELLAPAEVQPAEAKK